VELRSGERGKRKEGRKNKGKNIISVNTVNSF